MSCPNEFTWSIYVDGELPQQELRMLEMHLISCRTCRGGVVALQDENASLINVLFERAPSQNYRESAAARELSWSLPLAIAAVTAVLAIAGLVVELRLPGVLDLLNPRRLIGIYEMAFDALFIMRSRLPDLFNAAVSVGAMAAASALGCAGLHALSRRITSSQSMSLLLLVFIFAPDSVEALEFRKDQDTIIALTETISETLLCTGDVVSVDGTIDGDLVVAAERFTMRGRVTGNLYVIGREIEIDGIVEGSIIGLGENLRLGGRVEGAATLAGKRLNVSSGAQVGRDIALFGEGARMEGRAARDVTFAGEWIEVRAEIERDLHVLGAERVALLDGARIGRNVRAHLWGHRDQIEQAASANVEGDVTVELESFVRDHYMAHYQNSGFYVMQLVAAAAAFLFGLLIYILDPRLFAVDLPDARGFLRSTGIGFALLLAGPVALILLGMTVVGIPAAVLGLFILISAVYTSWILVAGLIGHAVYAPSGSGLGAFAPSLLIGVLIAALVGALPFVGPAIRILAVLFGLGCLFERARGVHSLNLRGIRG